MKRTIDYSLYLVTDRKVTDKKGRDFYEAVEEALQAGITLVQLREKDVTTEERIAIGRKVKILCDHYDVPLLVDDDIACAKAAFEALHIEVRCAPGSWVEEQGEADADRWIRISEDGQEEITWKTGS